MCNISKREFVEKNLEKEKENFLWIFLLCIGKKGEIRHVLTFKFLKQIGKWNS